jgi:glycosyltransferase involved in cell wall biosynthesis
VSIYFNVTDAVGGASNHGITRTERKLATAMDDDVEFVVMHEGRLWRVDRDAAVARFGSASESGGRPTIERFGVDRPPRRGVDRALVGRLASAVVGRGSHHTPGLDRHRLTPARGDVVISVGLDWTNDLLPEVERLTLGHGVRYVGFCYDLIPIDHPEWIFPADPIGFRRHLQRMVRVADSVICISNHTRHDFLRHFTDIDPERVDVLQLGADAAVEAGPAERAVARSVFDGEPYAIYCATLDRRKNHQLLYRAMRMMVTAGMPGNFVFVGKPGSGVGDLIDSLRHDPSIAGRIAHISDCDDAHLAAFYAESQFAVYPSLYEGWGLGVTEALANGKPCVVASGSSLGEAGLGVCPEIHPLRTADWVATLASWFESTPTLPQVELPTWRSAATEMLAMVTA